MGANARAVSDLALVQLLRQAHAWLAAKQVRPLEAAGRDDAGATAPDPPLSSETPESVAEVPPCCALACTLLGSLGPLWRCIKPRLAYIVKIAEQSSPGAGTCASDGESGQSEGGGAVDSSASSAAPQPGERYWLRPASVGCSALDLLVRFRSLCASVLACLDQDDRSYENGKRCLLGIAQDIDDLTSQVLHSGAVDYHPTQVRLAQLITLSMLEHAYLEGLLCPEDFPDSSRVAAGSRLGVVVVGTAAGGRFGGLLQDGCAGGALMGRASSRRDPQMAARGAQQDKLESLLARRHRVGLSAFAAVLEHTILLNPAMSVWALSAIVQLWAEQRDVSTSMVGRAVFEELSHRGQHRQLQYLLTANAELCVRWIVLPLLLREVLTETAASILNTLTVTMFGWAAPSISEAYESTDGDPDHHRSHEYVVFISDYILAGLAACHSDATTRAARLRINANLAEVYRLNTTLGTLIDERPVLLYRLVTCPAVQAMEEADLVGGLLQTFFQVWLGLGLRLGLGLGLGQLQTFLQVCYTSCEF